MAVDDITCDWSIAAFGYYQVIGSITGRSIVIDELNVNLHDATKQLGVIIIRRVTQDKEEIKHVLLLFFRCGGLKLVTDVAIGDVIKIKMLRMTDLGGRFRPS